MGLKLLLKKSNRKVRKLMLIQIARFCLYVFAVFVPFQIKVFFQTMDIYLGGQFNQYTNFFLYFSDLFLGFALIFLGLATITGEFNFKSRVGDKKLFVLMLGFVVLIEISSFWALNMNASFVVMARFIEFLVFYLLFVNAGCSMRFFVKILIFSIAIQSIIGIFQYIFQSSIGLGIFGEPLLSTVIPNVAKVDLGSMQFLRSYGTFSHPNVFGGFLVVAILLAFSRLSEDKFLYGILISMMIIALLLTFSRSAWIALMCSGLFYVFVTRPRLKVKYLGLTALIFLLFLVLFDLDQLFIARIFGSNDTALAERIGYIEISKNMFFEYPFGVGVGNFTLEMQSFVDQKLNPWELQPVHNVFLLALNEVGILILPLFFCFFGYICIATYKKGREFISGGDRRYGILLLSMFFMILIIANLDHYLFSLYQGQFLFFFYLLLVNDFLSRNVSV